MTTASQKRVKLAQLGPSARPRLWPRRLVVRKRINLNLPSVEATRSRVFHVLQCIRKELKEGTGLEEVTTFAILHDFDPSMESQEKARV